jgi:hypothetical protein
LINSRLILNCRHEPSRAAAPPRRDEDRFIAIGMTAQ